MISQKNRRYLRGRKIQKEVAKNRYYTFDIECAGLNPTHPLLICVTPFESYTKSMPSRWVFQGESCKVDFKNWLDTLPSTFNHVIYGHNGSRFDIYSVFDKWGILSAKKFERKGTIFWIQYKPNIEFRDSLHLLQAPLKSFGAKGTTPMKFIDSTHPDYGSYEAITELDIEYCIQDCIVLRDALLEMKRLLSEWTGVDDVRLPLTAASMAHRVWTMCHFPDEWKWIRTKGKNKGQLMYQTFIDERAEEVARKAYYGGRVQVIGEAGRSYDDTMSLDRNTMYGSEMMFNTFPDPTKTQPVADIHAVRGAGVHYWGRFHLRGEKGAVAFLPSLNDDDRRDYTQLEFDGFLCSPEVEYALQNGWRIVDYSDVWCSTSSMKPFEHYVDFFYSLRKEMKRNGDERQSLIKLLLNSLYGVFGTKGQFDRLENNDEIADALHKNPDGFEVNFWNAESEQFYLVSKEYKEPPQHTCFVWAAFVTSYARVSLDEAIQAVKRWGHEVVYVDTDSVHFANFNGDLRNCPLPVGKELGEWDIESVTQDGIEHEVAQTAQYFEPKVYTWFVSDEPIKIRHKGCSDSTGDPKVSQLNRSVIQYRMALRRQLEAGVMVETVKKSKRWYDNG